MPDRADFPIYHCTVDGSLEHFGIARDFPVDDDWSGTGKVQLGVFDPSAGLWELDPNRNGFWDDAQWTAV